MKIPEQDETTKRQVRTAQTDQPVRISPTATSAPRAPDRTDGVEISGRARALQAAAAALKGQPAIRAAKVARLKKQLADGTYDVPGEAIADKLLDQP